MTEYQRPVILLDVDGVLNFFRKSTWPDETVRQEMVDGGGAKFRITWSTAVTDWLKATALRADIQWSTTWNTDGLVRNIEATLGVGPWEQAFQPASVYHARYDKIFAAERLAQRGRPFVWIDDEVDDLAAHANFPAEGVDYVLVQPDDSVGLNQGHLDRIDAFLSRLEAVNR